MLLFLLSLDQKVQSRIEPRMRSCRGCQGRYASNEAAELQESRTKSEGSRGYAVRDACGACLLLWDDCMFVRVGIGRGQRLGLCPAAAIPLIYHWMAVLISPSADGVLQEINLILTQGQPLVTTW